MTKTKINRPSKCKLLGFGFYKNNKGVWRARPHADSVAKFKCSLKEMTGRSKSMNFRVRINSIKPNNKRVDKLPCHQRYENADERRRFTLENHAS